MAEAAPDNSFVVVHDQAVSLLPANSHGESALDVIIDHPATIPLELDSTDLQEIRDSHELDRNVRAASLFLLRAAGLAVNRTTTIATETATADLKHAQDDHMLGTKRRLQYNPIVAAQSRLENIGNGLFKRQHGDAVDPNPEGTARRSALIYRAVEAGLAKEQSVFLNTYYIDGRRRDRIKLQALQDEADDSGLTHPALTVADSARISFGSNGPELILGPKRLLLHVLLHRGKVD